MIFKTRGKILCPSLDPSRKVWYTDGRGRLHQPWTNPLTQTRGLISVTGLSLRPEFKVPAVLEMLTGVQEAQARQPSLVYTRHGFLCFHMMEPHPLPKGACDL